MEVMREQEHGGKEILMAIQAINVVTAEVQAGSREMLNGGESVAAEMSKLDELTQTINDSMNNMAATTVQIDEAIQAVSSVSQKNKRSINALVEEVGKFKVR